MLSAENRSSGISWRRLSSLAESSKTQPQSRHEDKAGINDVEASPASDSPFETIHYEKETTRRKTTNIHRKFHSVRFGVATMDISIFLWLGALLSLRLIYYSGGVSHIIHVDAMAGGGNPWMASSYDSERVRIVFNPRLFVHHHKYVLRRLPPGSRGDRDFGGLEFSPRVHFNETLQIESYNDAERHREALLEKFNGGRDTYQPESSHFVDSRCRRPSWYAYTFPSCNKFHEKPLERFHDDGYDISYLSTGSYRDSFRYQQQQYPGDHFVLKTTRPTRFQLPISIYKAHKEAIIMERLSPSPSILDIYAYCGTSVVVQPMEVGLSKRIVPKPGLASQEELDKLDDVYPRNNLTNSEKLQISLEMARSLADLHGFEGGPIAQGDVHADQWLVSASGSIKLNDFNYAVIPEWNSAKQNYCLEDEQKEWGDELNRAPQEYSGDDQDESIDTYSFGNIMYQMITGLWHFYDEQYREIPEVQIQKAMMNGTRPFIDPRYRNRSFIEGKLVQVMEACWTHGRRRRPSIFQVVSSLETVKEEAIRRGEFKESAWLKVS